MSEIKMRIEEKDAFQVIGRKTWIFGQDNEIFSRFWDESHKNGYIDEIIAYRKGVPGAVTKSNSFGVSRVEKDPSNRAFDFYIATEKILESDEVIPNTDEYTVPSCTWAIFSNSGELPMSLVEAEMHTFMGWLPNSEYEHAYAPELEVYPVEDSSLVEFWLPIKKR